MHAGLHVDADGADYAVDNNPDFDMRGVEVVDTPPSSGPPRRAAGSCSSPR